MKPVHYKLSEYDGMPLVCHTTAPVGELECGCCVVFATREEAKVHELELLRNIQRNVLAELAVIENHIVTVMRELNY